MFVEHKEIGEQQRAPAHTLKLSAAIRIGKPLVGTEAIDFRLCAMGCAWAGVMGRKATIEELIEIIRENGGSGKDFAGRMGVKLGFDHDICEAVSNKHCAGWPALQIADWLEGQGY